LKFVDLGYMLLTIMMTLIIVSNSYNYGTLGGYEILPCKKNSSEPFYRLFINIINIIIIIINFFFFSASSIGSMTLLNRKMIKQSHTGFGTFLKNQKND